MMVMVIITTVISLKSIFNKNRLFVFLFSLSFNISMSFFNLNFVDAAHEQYTLPLPSTLQHEPSYIIRIPFGAADRNTFSSYEPAEISIPAGMTVAWINDDSVAHTVTSIEKENEVNNAGNDIGNIVPLAKFDSGVIPPGGFAVFTFTKPGIYNYYDKFYPLNQGQIRVGDLTQVGNYFDMRIGGNIPFNFTELGRVVLSIIPKTISLPPPLEIGYNITILNSTTAVYNRQFGDIDGVLDLEIIPISRTADPVQIRQSTSTNDITTFSTRSGINVKVNENGSNNNGTNTSITNNRNTDTSNNNTMILDNTLSIPLSYSTIQTTTYGPDINSPITGTYHIQGPLFVEPTPYTIRVEIVSIDDKILQEPVTEDFILPPKIG